MSVWRDHSRERVNPAPGDRQSGEGKNRNPRGGLNRSGTAAATRDRPTLAKGEKIFIGVTSGTSSYSVGEPEIGEGGKPFICVYSEEDRSTEEEEEADP